MQHNCWVVRQYIWLYVSRCVHFLKSQCEHELEQNWKATVFGPHEPGESPDLSSSHLNFNLPPLLQREYVQELIWPVGSLLMATWRVSSPLWSATSNVSKVFQVIKVYGVGCSSGYQPQSSALYSEMSPLKGCTPSQTYLKIQQRVQTVYVDKMVWHWMSYLRFKGRLSIQSRFVVYHSYVLPNKLNF